MLKLRGTDCVCKHRFQAKLAHRNTLNLKFVSLVSQPESSLKRSEMMNIVRSCHRHHHHHPQPKFCETSVARVIQTLPLTTRGRGAFLMDTKRGFYSTAPCCEDSGCDGAALLWPAGRRMRGFKRRGRKRKGGVETPTWPVVRGSPHRRDGRRARGGIRPLSVPLYRGGGAHEMVLRIAVLKRKEKKRRDRKAVCSFIFSVSVCRYSSQTIKTKQLPETKWPHLLVKTPEVSVLPHAVEDLRCRFHHFGTMSGNSAESKKTQRKARLGFCYGWKRFRNISQTNKQKKALAPSKQRRAFRLCCVLKLNRRADSVTAGCDWLIGQHFNLLFF